MTVPFITQKETGTINLVPIVRQPQLGQWLKELEFLEDEAQFYCQFLRIGLRNGNGQKKPALYALHDAFAEMKDTILPGLKTTIKNMATNGDEQPQWVAAHLEKVEMVKRDMVGLKRKVFPYLSEIQQVTIW